MSFLDTLKKPLPSRSEIDDDVDFDSDLDLDLDDLDEFLDGDSDEDEPVTELDLDEDDEVDKIIDIAATPVVLKDTLGLESARNFYESNEFTIACDEGFFIEGERDALYNSVSNLFLENGESFLESKFYQKNTVRLTKESKLKQLYGICVLAIARIKKDVLYDKFKRFRALSKKCKLGMQKKYGSIALKKAQKYLARLRKSKSQALRAAGNKMAKGS